MKAPGDYPFFRQSFFFLLFPVILVLLVITPGRCADFLFLDRYLGENDAMIVETGDSTVQYAWNADTPLVPASTLKLLTSLAALEYLGDDWRFQTELYLGRQNDLIVKGYGDPLLISEDILNIAAALAEKIPADQKKFSDLVLDDSYFQYPLEIPGVTDSFEPYDAPNGALCANFNTVYFRSRGDDRYESAEVQTPLLSLAMDPIRKSGLKSGRIILSQKEHRHTRYAGQIFRHFLQKNGFTFRGDIRLGPVDEKARLLYTYQSPYHLSETISRLLYYSNNYIANQILITAGIVAYGPPGSLENGVRAVTCYAEEKLGLKTLRINEGSGISRGNRISAADLLKVARAFEVHRHLLRRDGREFYKTGTLQGVSTRVGYIETDDRIYRYVILLNSNGKSAERIKNLFTRSLDR
jgi:D-alanyl-D-alanine carboxypeptidase/D-alanyl-D-alanine-endopeptidase (penicillin-binding protein 4)